MKYSAAVFLWTGFVTYTGATNQGNPSPSAGNSNPPADSGAVFHDPRASSGYGANSDGVVPGSGFGGPAFPGFGLYGYGAQGSTQFAGYGTSSSAFGSAPAGYWALPSSYPVSSSAFAGAAPSSGNSGSGFGVVAAAHEASNSGVGGSMAAHTSSSGLGGSPVTNPSNNNLSFGAPSSGYGASPVSVVTLAPSLFNSHNVQKQTPGFPNASPHSVSGNHAGQEASMVTGSSGQQGTAGSNNIQQRTSSAALPANPSGGYGTGSYGYGTYASSGNPSQGVSASAPAVRTNPSDSYGQGAAPQSLYGQGPAASSSVYGHHLEATSPYGYPSSGYALPQQFLRPSARSRFPSGPAIFSAGFKPFPVSSARAGLKQIFKPFYPQKHQTSAPAKLTSSAKGAPVKSPRAQLPKKGKADFRTPIAIHRRFAALMKTGAPKPLASDQRRSFSRNKTKKNSLKYR